MARLSLVYSAGAECQPLAPEGVGVGALDCHSYVHADAAVGAAASISWLELGKAEAPLHCELSDMEVNNDELSRVFRSLGVHQ
jgi:hypothetical protein